MNSLALLTLLILASFFCFFVVLHVHAHGSNFSPDALEKAKKLVAQMTLDEKIVMVHGEGFPLEFGYGFCYSISS